MLPSMFKISLPVGCGFRRLGLSQHDWLALFVTFAYFNPAYYFENAAPQIYVARNGDALCLTGFMNC